MATLANVGDFWFRAGGPFLDLSQEENRRLFLSAAGQPVNLGSNGAAPLGVPPHVYFTGGAANFVTNGGSGGSFALSSGILTNSATAPPTNPGGAFVESGNVPPGADPQIMLSTSDDGARTWSALQKWRSMGKMGQYLQRLRWLKMGQFRQRVIKLEVTDPVRRRFIGFYQDTTEGME